MLLKIALSSDSFKTAYETILQIDDHSFIEPEVLGFYKKAEATEVATRLKFLILPGLRLVNYLRL